MKNVGVTLTPEEMERAAAFARDIAARYRSDGDRITAMPWTTDQLSDDELRAWLASRKEAGRNIDIETCEWGWWYAQIMDPYGIRQALGEFPEDLDQIGRSRFVRSPTSRGWVSVYDLPAEKAHALHARIAPSGGSTRP